MFESPLLRSLFSDRTSFESVVLPWSLNIVDCHFLATAFAYGNSVQQIQRMEGYESGVLSEIVPSMSVYDVYGADRDAGDFDLALFAQDSGDFCFWDQEERFVLIVGSQQFLTVARPYPKEIARHRFIEASWGLGGMSDEALGAMYDSLMVNPYLVSGHSD